MSTTSEDGALVGELDLLISAEAGPFPWSRLLESMGSIAGRPGGLLAIAERYGNSSNPDLVHAVAWLLSTQAETRADETESALRRLLERRTASNAIAADNLLGAILRLLRQGRFLAAAGVPSVAALLHSALLAGDVSAFCASDVIGTMFRVTGLAAMHAPTRQELRCRLQLLTGSADDLVIGGLQSAAAFLTGSDEPPPRIAVGATVVSGPESIERGKAHLAHLAIVEHGGDSEPVLLSGFRELGELAHEPGGFDAAVDRFAATESRSLASPLAYLAYAAVPIAPTALMPLVLRLFDALQCRTRSVVSTLEEAAGQIHSALWQAMAVPKAVDAHGAPRELLPFLGECLDRSPAMQRSALLTLACLVEDDALRKFEAAQMQAIREKLRRMARQASGELGKELAQLDVIWKD